MNVREAIRSLQLPSEWERLTYQERDDVFDFWWLVAAECGAVDSLGGAEWCRIKQHWQVVGRPGDIDAFVHYHMYPRR